jgi:hypothetical protein
VKQRELDTCGECNEFEFCPRVIKLLQQAKHADSLLSYLTVEANFKYVRRNGIKKWDAQQQEKIAFLKTLLENYNDGRSKSFFCLSAQLIPLNKLKAALAAAQEKITPEMALKEKAKIVKGEFNGAAEKCGIELKLRKGK